MGTVFLHVGTMKSGTTYVQKSLDAHSDELAARGIRWFGTQATNQAVQDLLQNDMLLPGSKGAWGRLATRIRSSDEDAVISMELLGPASNGRRRRIKESLRTHDLTLVLTVRDVSRVALSHWQETVQNRHEVGWAEFCESICAADPPADESPARFWVHHDVLGVIDRYSSIVARDAMRIVTVPSSRDDPELLWRRFCAVLGFDPIGAQAPPTSSNTSIGAVSAELMMRVNARTRDFDWEHYRRGIKAPLSKMTLSRRAVGEPRYGLSDHDHALLRARAVQMAADIEAAGIGVTGDLADIVPPERAGAPDLSPGEVTAEQLLDAALDGIAGMGKRLADIRIQRDALREKVLRLSTPPPPPPPPPAAAAPAVRRPGRVRRWARRVPGLARLAGRRRR